MKLKVQQLMAATLVLKEILEEKRPMPTKGAYRLGRLHAKLLPEYKIAAERRDALIIAYDHHAMISVPASTDYPLGQRPSADFSVPPDKVAEFTAAWGEIGSEEIEVEVEPVPLSTLDMGDKVASPVAAVELQTLGDLVTDA